MKKAIVISAKLNIRCKPAEDRQITEYFGADTTLYDLLMWIATKEEKTNGWIDSINIREDDITLIERIRKERRDK